MVHACQESNIEPVVTLLHFTCPKWLITRGGWESDTTPDYFERYVRYVCNHLQGEKLHYIVTINEANMGTLISGYLEKIQKHTNGAGLQIGMDLEEMAAQQKKTEEENLKVFGVKQAAVFTSPRSKHGDVIVQQAHKQAVQAIHEMPQKIGEKTSCIICPLSMKMISSAYRLTHELFSMQTESATRHRMPN